MKINHKDCLNIYDIVIKKKALELLPTVEDESGKRLVKEYAELLNSPKYSGGDAELEWFAYYYKTEIILIDISVRPVQVYSFGKQAFMNIHPLKYFSIDF